MVFLEEFSLSFCELCRKVWETVFIDKRNKTKMLHQYYIDFPTYKMKREHCPRCLESKK